MTWFVALSQGISSTQDFAWRAVFSVAFRKTCHFSVAFRKKVAIEVERQLSTDKNLVKIVPELVEINHAK